MSELIISARTTKSSPMTIRIDAEIQDRYTQLAKETNISRNELIGMALRYALDNMRIHEAEPVRNPFQSEEE